MKNLNHLFLALLSVAIIFTSCKKEKEEVPDNTPQYTTCSNNGYYEKIDTVYSPPYNQVNGVDIDHANLACGPNIFTPNGDGKNDNLNFWIAGVISDFDLSIYSSTDVLVFQTQQYSTTVEINGLWNGMDTTGAECPAGKYRATVHFIADNGTEIDDCFNVWIIRNATEFEEYYSTECAFPDQIHPLYGKIYHTGETY